MAEEEEPGVVAYVFTESLAGLPAPEGLFHDDTASHGDDDGVEPEPAFTWRQDGETTRCYVTRDGRAAFCYQLANGTAIGAKNVDARSLARLFRKLFDRLSQQGKKGGKPSNPDPSPAVNSRYGASATNVALFQHPIALQDLIEQFPSWGWPTYPRGYVTVPPEELPALEGLIEKRR